MSDAQLPSKDLSMAAECRGLGCQRNAAVKIIDELRAQNAALMAECAHYREKLRELSKAATAAFTVLAPAAQCTCPAPGTSSSIVSPFCRVHASSQPAAQPPEQP